MNMMEQIWKIRDSRGLDTYEKNFLYTIASRGEAGMFCEWKRNSEDMGMKKDRYYKTRKLLVDKGLIHAQERKENSTVYKIVDAALVEWEATHSVSQNDDSATQNDRSATQNDRSVTPERKKNLKKNLKKNSEELNESASASSFPQDQNETNKDDQATAPASPIGDNLPAPAAPMEVTTEGHSATQNEELSDEQRRKLHFSDPRWLPPLPKPKAKELAW